MVAFHQQKEAVVQVFDKFALILFFSKESFEAENFPARCSEAM